MMKKLFVLFYFLLFFTQSYSQGLQELLDSSNEHWDNENYAEAFTDLSKAVELAEVEYKAASENAAFSYAFLLNQMGVRLFAAENFETAATYYSAAIPIYKSLQGEQGSDYLVSIENLALCYNSYGKTEDALQLYTYLLENETYQKSAGNNIYETYNTAAICAYQIDQYELSKEYYLKSLAYISEEAADYWVIVENLITLEKTWAKYEYAFKYLELLLTKFPDKEKEYSNIKAYYHRDLGLVEFNKGNFPRAIAHLKNTVEFLIPEDSIDEVSAIYALQDLTAAYSNARLYKEGFPYMVENEKKVKAHYGEQSDDYLIALSYVSLAAAELGNYKAASRYYKVAYRTINKLEGDSKGEMQSTFDLNYSDYMLKLGKYADAKTHAQRAFTFYRTNEKKYFDDLLFSMNFLGILFLSEGEYDKAEAILKQTLKLQLDNNGLENEMGTKIASNLTSLYIQTGRYSRAYQFLDFVLANDLQINGSNSLEYSFSLQVAGVLYVSSGQYDKAIETLKKSYEIRKPLVGEKNRELLRLKQSLGTAYFKAGKLTMAEQVLTEVLTDQKASLGIQNLDCALSQNDLAMVYYAKNDYRQAVKLFEQSYDIKKKVLGRYNQFTVTSLFNMACVNVQMGQVEKAFEYFKLSTDDYLYILDNYFPFLSEKERLEYYHTIKGQLSAYFSFLSRQLVDHPEYASLLYNTHIRTKAILLSESVKLRNFLNNHQDEKVKQIYVQWNAINGEIAKLDQTKNEGDKKVYLDSLKIVGEEYERVLNSLTQKSIKPKNITWIDVSARLNDGEVAVEIIRIKEFDFEKNEHSNERISYLALIIDNETKGAPSFIRLDEGFLLDSKYFNVYKNNIKYKLEDKVSYEKFWKHIAEKLSGYKKIYFSSDGVYHLINLNTLYNTTTSKYVIEESNIEIVGNTAEILNKKSTYLKPENATLFGFPNFNAKPDKDSHDTLRTSIYRDIFTAGVSDLPGTKVEVSNINKLMNSAGVSTSSFLSDDAHESNLKEITAVDILHIATHGFFEESSADVVNDDPLTHSGLLLANIKESTDIQEENGIITAKEVAQLDLAGNKLVVLSACETGKGKVVDGEGVYGLQRAFQVAGADNVIISLWKVDDEATQKLMTYFYEFYLQSNNARDALRHAQTTLQVDYSHPNYWGAFYVIGN